MPLLIAGKLRFVKQKVAGCWLVPNICKNSSYSVSEFLAAVKEMTLSEFGGWASRCVLL